MKDLNDLREQIDEVDNKIIYYIAQRLSIVKEIAIYKKENNMSSLQPQRWHEVLNSRINYGREKGINEKLINDIWNNLHQQSLIIEDEIIKNLPELEG